MNRREARIRAATQVDLAPLFRSFVSRHRVGLVLAFGGVFRVAQWLADRALWMDEARLWGNIRSKSIPQLFGPLDHAQLAPAGFLVAERLVGLTLGPTPLWLRLLPLLGGVATLFLARDVARRCLLPGAVLVALALVATSGDLIYFASELKPYSTDTTVALGCVLMGMWLESRPLTAPRLLALGTAGALAAWFSFPAAFGLAGVGVVLMGSALAGRAWGRAVRLVAIGSVWVASVAACQAVARVQLVERGPMDAFWGFALWPLPPKSASDLLIWPLLRGLYLFVNPLEFPTPLGPNPTALLAAALFVVGCGSLARRDLRALGLLVLPGVFALVASGLHAYPFHGRMVLFFAPALLLLIAEGCGRVRLRLGRVAFGAVVLVLLAGPGLVAVYHLAEPRQRIGFNPHGDLRPASLKPGHFPF